MTSVADLFAYICAILGLAAVCGGVWVLLVLHGRLARPERNQAVMVILVGVILIVVGYTLSRPAY